MSVFDGYVQAKFHGGVMANGPCFTVIHDAETPLASGYTDSIVEFFRKGPPAGTSAHAMVDPSKAVKMLPDNVVAYAAGPVANTYGWHCEQAGYASFTRAQWLTAPGKLQLARVGACFAEIHNTWGIPKRLVTDAQLKRAAAGDRSSGGITTHGQIARVLGGTTHTDPGPNYPTDLLLEAVLNPQGDDMQADERKALFDIHAWVRGTDPNVDALTVLWIQNKRLTELLVEVRAMIQGGNPAGENNFHWLDKNAQLRFAALLAEIDSLKTAP